MTAPTELLPCPFCGKAMMLRGALWPAEGDRDAVIHAEPTDCPLYEFSNDTADESIIEVWNRRAPSPSPAPGVVTEEMVETAARAYAEHQHGKGCPVWEEELPPMRAALASLSQPAKGEREVLDGGIDGPYNESAPLADVVATAQPALRQECATEGCDNPASVHFVRGDIGSWREGRGGRDRPAGHRQHGRLAGTACARDRLTGDSSRPDARRWRWNRVPLIFPLDALPKTSYLSTISDGDEPRATGHGKDRKMTKRYHISSTSSVYYGLYEGETAKEAFLAMVEDAGGAYGDETTGTEEDWIITEVE